MHGLEVRPARTEDLPAVARIVNAAYREGGGRAWTTEAALVGGARATQQGLAAILDAPRERLLVAEWGGRVVGSVHLAEDAPGDVVLGMLAVEPALQAAGAGRRLLDAGEAEARAALGARRVVLHVVTARAELVAWYVRRGYRRTGEVLPFEPGAEERLLGGPLAFERLEKRLPPAGPSTG